MKTTKEIRQFINDLTRLKDRAGRLELFKTMHEIDKATQAVGYEVAELMQKRKPVLREGKLEVGQLYAHPEYGHLFLVFEIPHPKPHESFRSVTIYNLAWHELTFWGYLQSTILEEYVCVGMAKDIVAELRKEIAEAEAKATKV